MVISLFTWTHSITSDNGVWLRPAEEGAVGGAAALVEDVVAAEVRLVGGAGENLVRVSERERERAYNRDYHKPYK